MLARTALRAGSRLGRSAPKHQFAVRWASTAQTELLKPSDSLIDRHIGPSEAEIAEMLAVVGYKSLDEFMDATVPNTIKNNRTLGVGEHQCEAEALARLRVISQKNKVLRSHIGMGYYDTITPGTILRNVLENPAWYTSYTPYQAEVSQGRMESLLNYQTMVKDLTGMELANASLLDEGTAAAEAMSMCVSINPKAKRFFVSDSCHPQSLAVIQQRAEPLGVEVVVGDHREFDFESAPDLCGALVQYPATDGRVDDMTEVASKIKSNAKGKCKFVVSTDLLALAKLQPPGEFGADIALGSAQRFGVPMGYGGPHAGFFAVSGGSGVVRKMPGRIMGISVDADGNPGIRLALQTREQHIRRDKATSNVCTAQALLANISAMYAIYHGPEGIKRIADRTHACAVTARMGLQKLGYSVDDGTVFDTIRVRTDKAEELMSKAVDAGFNMRRLEDGLGLSFDETTTPEHLNQIFGVFGGEQAVDELLAAADLSMGPMERTSPILTNPVFNSHHSEMAMQRYIFKLADRDISLTRSMIPLGSCTMKLNATSEMIPVTWPEFGNMHPFVPLEQAEGYQAMIQELSDDLCDITGFAGITLQPNSGAQGEFTGLLAIKAYHEANNNHHRKVCLIPSSAHGTNPASASMCGMKVVVVKSSANGDVDMEDLKAKVDKHADNLGALMITYPSTHGVYEETIVDICQLIHDNGGQVYMDGANMNAQVGYASPGEIGADVCHLNLHKTFCIPHGGGGPGVGPIGVAQHLKPFLPSHPVIPTGGEQPLGPISAAPWGSASILPITYMYIKGMGAAGLKKGTAVAVLNANYMAERLSKSFPILYTGANGRNAHEFILNINPIKTKTGISEKDIAKRLMDYGFHAPTMSWPAVGTLMVEPTESEYKAEMDRYILALETIRAEIQDVEDGVYPADNNPLVNAPHSLSKIVQEEWDHPYSREQAAFPLPFVKAAKFWPSARVNDEFGDRNLVCSCPPMEAYDDLEIEIPASPERVKQKA